MSISDFVSIVNNGMRTNLSYILYYPGEQTSYREHKVEGALHCGICLETFCIGDLFIALPCNECHPHKFHPQCIVLGFEVIKHVQPAGVR